ncbi:MAG: peptidase [Gammaproteobacteria bacterium]|jgi:murein DD-endopeptidase MepM/ murein hydrolase activator NlpD|nr:peptidase [Gammaproteobacteria bacterium]
MISSLKTRGAMAAVRRDVRSRRRVGLYPLLILSLLVAFFIFFWPQNDVPTTAYDDTRYVQQNDFSVLPGNTVSIDSTDAVTPPAPQAYDKNVLIRRGDTLNGLLLAQNIQTQDIAALLSIPLVKRTLAHISPGQMVNIHVNADQELTDLTYALSPTQTLSVTRLDDNFDAKLTKKPTSVMPTIAAGVITSTFYEAGLAQHLPQKIILDATHLFASKINFKRGLKPGDHFKVIYESSYVQNKTVATGNILAMEISNDGKTYTLVRHVDSRGVSRYYPADSHALRNAVAVTAQSTFLRTPVHYTRISSSFSMKRVHPLLLFSRPHYGVDLAAPRGTPVVASANGIVTVAGKEGGYGNLVIINHGHGVTTRYGHLNRFASNIHAGSAVKQGQVIAYVGSTGLASGPHLHYEYRVNNVPQNPLTVKLPLEAHSISSSEQKQFNREVNTYLAQLHNTPLSVVAYAPGLSQNKNNTKEA